MKFSEACLEAVKLASEKGRVFYVHEYPSMWDITFVFKPGWLFKAYPGGRKVVSPAGKSILESEKELDDHARR